MKHYARHIWHGALHRACYKCKGTGQNRAITPILSTNMDEGLLQMGVRALKQIPMFISSRELQHDILSVYIMVYSAGAAFISWKNTHSGGKTTIAKWKTSAPFQTQQEFVTYVSSVNL